MLFTILKKLSMLSFPTLFILFPCAETAGQNYGLRQQLARIIQPVQAHIGVSIKHLENEDTISYNGHDHFPMQSIFKFHLALAVLHEVDKGKLSLTQKIHVKKDDLLPGSWSPLSKKYPEGNIDMSLQEVLRYTVAQGDNAGCDLLFQVMGGTGPVEKYIHGLGIKETAIMNNEREMHTDWNIQFNNWSEPIAMVRLLELFYQGNILSPQSRNLLLGFMQETITGRKRIKGLLPQGTVVAHRTGMGAQNKSGVWGAINNAGIVTLPDGNHIAIAVFISRTTEDPEKMEEVIARIAKAAYDHYLEQ